MHQPFALFRENFRVTQLLAAFFAFGMVGAGLLEPISVEAQVAITLGVQEVYDDNVFLENDRRRPAPLVLDDALEADIADGDLSVFYSDQADGSPDDDFITNVFIAAATDVPQLKNYADINLDGRIGGLFFADYDDQNRITLDGTVSVLISDLIIPQPYYIEYRSALRSDSGDIGVAQGTASRASETLDNTLSLGVRNWEVRRNTRFALGYTAAYHLFLGEFLFSDKDDRRFEEEGSDYHSHTVHSSLEYDVSNTTAVGVRGSAGVQLFTDVERNDALTDFEDDEDQFNRTNGDAAFFVRYNPTAQLSLSGHAGIQLTSFHEDQEPRPETVIGPEGLPEIILVERDDSETSFVFGGSANYIFEPGTALLLGLQQEVGTDIDGQRITTRSTYANLTKGFGDRFRLDTGFTFVQFSTEEDLSRAIDRAEFSASASYQLTQSTALVLGYNYINQDSGDDSLEEFLRFRSQEYEVNRVFLSLNVGLVGLPL